MIKLWRMFKAWIRYRSYQSRVACICDQISQLPEHEQTMVYFYMKKKRAKRFSEPKFKIVK